MSEIASKRVLTVDDSRASLSIMKRLLADSSFEVVGEARRGTEALEQYRKLLPDFVLLDIVMPDMDGIKVLEEIRKLDPQARVVMFSSMGTPDKIRECSEKGAKGFMMKPCRKEELVDLLTSLCSASAPAPASDLAKGAVA